MNLRYIEERMTVEILLGLGTREGAVSVQNKLGAFFPLYCSWGSMATLAEIVGLDEQLLIEEFWSRAPYPVQSEPKRQFVAFITNCPLRCQGVERGRIPRQRCKRRSESHSETYLRVRGSFSISSP